MSWAQSHRASRNAHGLRRVLQHPVNVRRAAGQRRVELLPDHAKGIRVRREHDGLREPVPLCGALAVIHGRGRRGRRRFRRFPGRTGLPGARLLRKIDGQKKHRRQEDQAARVHQRHPGQERGPAACGQVPHRVIPAGAAGLARVQVESALGADQRRRKPDGTRDHPARRWSDHGCFNPSRALPGGFPRAGGTGPGAPGDASPPLR